MKRWLYTVLIGIVLAGIVHILIVLLVPSYAAKDAWAKLEATGKPWAFNVVVPPGKSNEILPLVDPSFGVAACRFDLGEAPLIVEADGLLPYWSVAIFDRRGRNIYSFNDRTAIDRRLSLIVVDAVQQAQLRKNPTDDLDKSVLVRSDSKRGFVLIRAFLKDQSWFSQVDGFLKNATCEKYEIEDA